MASASETLACDSPGLAAMTLSTENCAGVMSSSLSARRKSWIIHSWARRTR
jgi:hypothetical protein